MNQELPPPDPPMHPLLMWMEELMATLGRWLWPDQLGPDEIDAYIRKCERLRATLHHEISAMRSLRRRYSQGNHDDLTDLPF